MTYRKLFHIFLLGSSMLLGALWARSLVASTLFSFAPKSFSGRVIYCGLDQASLWFGMGPSYTWPDGFSLHTLHNSERLLADEHQTKWGRFDLHMNDLGVNTKPSRYRVEFPIWLPWWVVVGASFLVTRRLEKRSAATREKVLAEEQESAQDHRHG